MKVMVRATSEAKAAMDAAVREATARAAGEVRAAEKARAAVELEAMRAAGARIAAEAEERGKATAGARAAKEIEATRRVKNMRSPFLSLKKNTHTCTQSCSGRNDD